MVRVITQETYDDVVKENIEDLDLSPEEAVVEAIAQFEAQGVDLSNIIKDLVLTSKGDEHLIVKLVAGVRQTIDNNLSDNEALNSSLIKLTEECNKGIPYKIKAGKEGAYSLLLRCLNVVQNDEVKYNILKALIALMDGQPDLLDSIGIKVMIDILDTTKNNEILILTLKWIALSCIKHETNRQNLFKAKIAESLKNLLKKHTETNILCEVLSMMRKLVLDDDIRVQFGKAHDHAKELAISNVNTLTKMLTVHVKDRQMTSQLLQTIAVLLVRHEFCQMVCDAGGSSVIFQILTDYYDDLTVIQQAFKLVKALSGNDDVKINLMKNGIGPILVSLIVRHMNNPNACALGLACISLIALREPTHSEILFENGIADAIVTAMNTYPNDCSVQKNACWSIRNLVARSRENCSKFLELGVEELLQHASNKFGKEFDFDIKSALRDLGCTVKLDEQWKGTGVQMSF